MAFDQQKYQSFLNRMKLKACPFCGSSNYTTNGTCYSLSELSPQLKPTGNVYPLVILACSECGYTFQFSAKLAGII